MRQLSITILLFLFIHFAVAQNYKRIDSLKQAFALAKEDTNKVWLYEKLAFAYQWSAPDSSLLYSIPGLALSTKLNFSRGQLEILLPISEALSMKGNYSKALEFRFKALELARKTNNLQNIANALALIGAVYYYSKDYEKALIYYYKGVETYTVDLGWPEIIWGFIGEAYFQLNQFDSASLYIERTYSLDIESKTFHWSTPYFYLGAIYEKKGNFEKSLAFYRKSNSVASNKIDILNVYNGMASVYNDVGKIDSAIFYANKVIAEGSVISFPAPAIEAYTLLANVYKTNRNKDSALKYQELLLAGRDSLFSQDKVKQMQSVEFNEQMRQQEIEIDKEHFKNRIKLYLLIGVLAVFFIIGLILWRNNRHKQKVNVMLYQKNEQIEKTLEKLKSTQAQLIQSEKMASLGELTAGIAHEIQNPLNFVNNFSEVNREMIDELQTELKSGNIEEAINISDDIKSNEEKINHHGKRADAIVKGMLQHSRTSTGVKESTNINALADEYLRLSYHGLRAKDKSFNATMKTDFDETIGEINIIPQDIGRVLLNLFNNAFYAVNEKKNASTSSTGQPYEPTVTVSTKTVRPPSGGLGVLLTVSDNGNGIPQKIVDKIFQPFFTTKPTGDGTGLGLSLSYDIVKAHGGEIKVETKEGEGSAFIIKLPFG